MRYPNNVPRKKNAPGEIRARLGCIGQKSRQLRKEQLKFSGINLLGRNLRTCRTAPRIDSPRPLGAVIAR